MKVRSYIIAYTIFPKGFGCYKTRFEVINNYKQAINFYKRLMTENKCFYKQVFKEELEEIEKNENI